jgi:hypothetical protein
MSIVRNKKAYLEARVRREQIEAAMLVHERQRGPLARPLTGKEIQELVPDRNLSTIYRHMQAIRREYERLRKERV